MGETTTKESKNNYDLTKEGKDTDLTWDEATMTWDDAHGTWDNPGRPMTRESKNANDLGLEVKHSDSGPNSPGTMENIAIPGSYFSWVNPNNAKISDDSYVTSSLGMTPLYDKVISLVLADGSYGTENKKTGLDWVDSTDTYFSYGGTADAWGEILTGADVNDSDFGILLQIDQNNPDGAYSDYLKASNFGFTIPTNAIISGILVEIERNYIGDRPKTPQIDHIRITIYY